MADPRPPNVVVGFCPSVDDPGKKEEEINVNENNIIPNTDYYFMNVVFRDKCK